MSQAAEESVIGAMLLDPACIDRIADLLHPADFADPFCRRAYDAIARMFAQGEAIDVLTVTATHPDLGLAELATLVNETPTSANVVAYARMVSDAALSRRLHGVSREIAEIAEGPGKGAEKLDRAQALFAALHPHTTGKGLVGVASVLADVVDEMDAARNRKSPLTGLATGFADLDKLTSGLQAGDLIIVAARPSMGKTSFAMNIAEHVAVDLKQRVAVFSLEMPSKQIMQRALAARARLDFQRVRSAELAESEWSRLMGGFADLNSGALFLDDTPGISVQRLRAEARRIQREGGLSLIVVDYLQLMSGEGENQNQVISAISRGLKAIAKELKVPVIALSQLNRGLEQRADKRPVMSDLRESGAIEQDADLILCLYRDEVYDPESTAKGTAEILIRKQRNGPLGRVCVTFLGEYLRFENYAGPPIEYRKPGNVRSFKRGMDD